MPDSKVWEVFPLGRVNQGLLLLLLLIATSCPSHAQSADQLLRETAKNYQQLKGYQLKGHAVVVIPGSAWKTRVDFTLIGPSQMQSLDGGPPKNIPSGVLTGRSEAVKTAMDSQEPQPEVIVPSEVFDRFDQIAENVLNVGRVGSDSLFLDGVAVPCDLLKVTYTPSTYEHPHPEAVTYWISPAKHLVLKETLAFSAGRHTDHAQWTIVVDSAKFDQPAPQWMVDAAKTPEVKERTEWAGKAAPEFALPGADGSLVKLSALRGKVVLLDFWSITCGPCLLEMPMIEDVGSEFEGQGLAVLGISFDPAKKSKGWLDRNNRKLRTLTDSDFVASDAFKVQGIPALVLIGRDGKVKQYWEGAVSRTALQAALNSMLRK